ncbi:SRPBCC domain-containing protein [Zhihengliuella alba]|uniref:SRPBCC domain-containing protein n=1 Tax=Zhihengliuella alba TaxID=547018 RepID=A0ABP7D8Y3_9MICC
MPVKSVMTDVEDLELIIRAQFDAPPARVWKVWSDPRLLERWWGPPEWPATFTRFEFQAGGNVRYRMTGPDSEQVQGWWQFEDIVEPRRLEFKDGFADDDGEPSGEHGVTHNVVTLVEAPGESTSHGTLMTLRVVFASLAQLKELLDMDMEDGLRDSVNQIDALLASRH